MRAATAFTLALPLLLADCGSRGDLVIGREEALVAGGPPVIPGGGAGATAGSAGMEAGGSSGSGGSDAEAGTSGTGVAGEGGAEGGAGAPGDGCVEGDEVPLSALAHRYSFDGTGSTVVDSIAGADGSLVNGALLDGTGVLTLPGNRDGQPDQYLNLPNGLISSLSEVTIVAWTTWLGGAGYQRVFDFGISDQGEVQGNSGKSYVAVMPSTGFANGTGLGAEITAPGFATQQLASPEMMKDRPAQVAFAFKSGLGIELFLDGKSLIGSPTTLMLSTINDKNNWVGESQWSKDHPYHGTFDEVRIYSLALTACQLRTMLDRGADTL